MYKQHNYHVSHNIKHSRRVGVEYYDERAERCGVQDSGIHEYPQYRHFALRSTNCRSLAFDRPNTIYH